MLSRLIALIIGLIVPILAIVALFPWYDRVHPLVLGFPFLYFWIFMWFPLTTLCLYVAWKLEHRALGEEER
ncbi:MAG: DUF3311 domain-containing protein [Firmicutes bacterium]|nr:DUF3311 domain-containing protein [Bacillota bacterium]MCL5014226.1 DUF3311 domain-containing protein [Bacillota bacterium]